MILISPYAKAMRNGQPHPKNYPYWPELVELIYKNTDDGIVQLGLKGEKQLVASFRQNLAFHEIKKLLDVCRFFISIDSFLPHMAHHYGKNGVVLWGQSDPNIFGYKDNLNILKSRESLREKQFDIWEHTDYNKTVFKAETFVEPEEAWDLIAKRYFNAI